MKLDSYLIRNPKELKKLKIKMKILDVELIKKTEF